MEKIWLKNYPPSVPPEIDVEQYPSIPAMIDSCVAKFGPNKAFTNMGKTLTFAQTGEMVQRLASFFQNVWKIKKGDRVAVMMPNVLQYPLCVFAILKAGGVVVNVNPLYTPRELEHQLNDAQVSGVVVIENFANTLEQVWEKIGRPQVMVASLGDLLGPVKGAMVNFVLRKVKKMAPEYRLPGAVTFKQALAQGASAKFEPVELSLADLAFLQYTGGTTGIAKGAMLTHGNICANALQARVWVLTGMEEGKEVALGPLPFYHIFALTIDVILFFVLGGRTVMITNPRDLGSIVRAMKRDQITVFIGINTLYKMLLQYEPFLAMDHSKVRLCFQGGMAIQESVAAEWKRLFGKTIINAYGMTESSPGVVVQRLDVVEGFSQSSGYPVSNTDISIRQNGEEVAPGETGEIWVKGPQVFGGYWNNPEETAKSLDKDGYFASGDIGRVDPETGEVYLIDRKKDMIVVSGFNVYPNEVEAVATALPGVLEAACVGVKSEKSGEAVKLFVVKDDPNLTEEDVIAHCRKNLTPYKVPKQIEFRDDLPKSNVGKILRRALKE